MSRVEEHKVIQKGRLPLNGIRNFFEGSFRTSLGKEKLFREEKTRKEIFSTRKVHETFFSQFVVSNKND